MSATLRITKPAEELSQLEREVAAWENYCAALKREDRDEAIRLWKVYAQIHAQRPVRMVERMEREKGLI